MPVSHAPEETFFHKNVPVSHAPVSHAPEEIPQDEPALDQLLRGLRTDISPDSGDAMASALGLLIYVDDDSGATSDATSESSSIMD